MTSNCKHSPNTVVTLLSDYIIIDGKSQEVLLNICLAFCTSTILQLSCTWKADLQCHWNATHQCSFHSVFFTFSPPFFVLKPWGTNCFSLNKGIFVCAFSPLVRIQLTCFPKTFATVLLVPFSLLCFSEPWSTGSSAPGLRVSGHCPLIHSCWTPRCGLKYLFCFVRLETMSSCLFCETWILMKQHV